MRTTLALLASTMALASTAANAVVVVPTSYAMPNGSGQASGGTYNYWDRNYTGTGSTTTDGAALSGGKGDLTDGVVANNFWYNVENNAGTGPYVGWREGFVANPLVTFSFTGSPTINGITVHVDNSNTGGVFAPASILIDGVATPFTAPANGTIGTVSFTGLNLTGNSHTLQFTYACSGCWVFVSEVGFSNTATVVPEPASWAMMIGGFGLLGATMRRRRALAFA